MNRSRQKIIADILSSVQEPVLKTMIMYKAKLSYEQLKVYTEYLQEKRLIQRTENNLWAISDKGRMFLRNYQSVVELIG